MTGSSKVEYFQHGFIKLPFLVSERQLTARIRLAGFQILVAILVYCLIRAELRYLKKTMLKLSVEGVSEN